MFDEETVAMVHGLRNGRQYSQRSYMKEMNNNITSHLGTQPNLTSSQAREQRDLLELDFGSKHRKGASNQATDALSQRNNHVISYMLTRIQVVQLMAQCGTRRRNPCRKTLSLKMA